MKSRRLRRLLFAVPALAAAWALWGWYWGDFLGPVTEAEARGYFAKAVDAVQRKDFDALCKLNSSYGTCHAELQNYCPESFPDLHFPDGEELDRVCREAAPTQSPTIVRSCYWPPKSGQVGGQILVVRGVDGRGKPYETEVLVFRDARSFKSQHTVYWSGDKFRNFKSGEPIAVGPDEPPPGVC
jgi:hypothetical protein